MKPKEIAALCGKGVDTVRKHAKKLLIPIARGKAGNDFSQKNTDRILKSLGYGK